MISSQRALETQPACCCICGTRDAEPVGVGEDFEYRTSPDSFLAVRCTRCGVVYLDPRPSMNELETIYPDDYHAFAFDEARFGIVYKARSRLEARRLLKALSGLPSDARILDVGCGDGFHLDLLRQSGPNGWCLEGVELDHGAATIARQRGISVHQGRIEDADLGQSRFDAVMLIQTIEHLADPMRALKAIQRLLVPGGLLLIVTDNTGSLDFAIAKRRHWGGYHWPRHWYLFNASSLKELATRSGFETVDISTMTSPVNWTYSVRNALDDWGAPRRLVDFFSLESPVALAAFTVFDAFNTLARRGALLRAVFARAQSTEEPLES